MWSDLPSKPAGAALAGVQQEELDGLFSYHHGHLLARLEQRLVSFQDELLDRLQTTAMATPNKKHMGAPGPLWASSMEEPVQSRRVSLGTELLLGGPGPVTPGPSVQEPPVWQMSSETAGSPTSRAGAVLSSLSAFRKSGDDPSKPATVGKATDATVIAPQHDPPSVEVEPATRMTLPSGPPTQRYDSDVRNRAHRLVHSRHFEVFFGVTIVANAVFIGVQTDAVAKDDFANALLFDVVSNAFALLFTIELIAKLICYRWNFFCAYDTWHWNILDLVVVATSLVEAAATIYLGAEEERASVESQSTSQFRILRIVRISRVIKVVRMIRLIRFVRALRTMVHQLMSTMKPLLWAVLLLCLIMYLFAILFTQSVLIHRTGDGHTPPSLLKDWSSLPRSMLTLFMAVTGGINWGDTVDALSLMGPLPVVLFVGYIAFAEFAVLNVLTGVFCQNAIDSASHDQELVAQDMLANKQMYIQNMQQLFKEFDADKDGSVTVTEFMAHLNDERVRAYFDSLDLDTSDVCTLFRLLDTTDHNELELDEFVSGCMRLKGNAKGVDMAKLSYAQSAMARRLARFMERTDTALSHLTESAVLPKEEEDHPDDLVNAMALAPPRRRAGLAAAVEPEFTSDVGNVSEYSSRPAPDSTAAVAVPPRGGHRNRRFLAATPATGGAVCL